MTKQTYPKKASGDWHRADIKAALEKAGWTLSELSTKNGYNRTAVGIALAHPWPKVEAIIAKAVGVPPQSIWPSRYHPDGTSVVPPPGPPRRNSSSTAGKAYIQQRRVG